MKNKAFDGEYEVVRYYLVNSGVKNASATVVHALVEVERQLWASVRNMFIYFFGFVGLCAVFNSIAIPYGKVIALTCGYLAIASLVVFVGMAVFNFRKFVNFCWLDTTYNEAPAGEIITAIYRFKKLYGKWPEKLGRDGVAKKMTAVAKKITTAPNGKNSHSQNGNRARLKAMYDAAKVFMPVSRYEEIYAAAEAGLKMPPLIPIRRSE